MNRTGVITKGTTIGGGKSANPGDIVTLRADDFVKLAITGDIRELKENERKPETATSTKKIK